MTDPRAATIAICVFCITFPLPFLFLRVVGRRIKHVALGADDVLAMLAYLVLLAASVVLLIGVTLGNLGQHELIINGKYVATEESITEKKMCYIAQVLDLVSATLVKMSILLLYRRLFGSISTFKKINTVLCGLISLWGTVYTFATIFQCIPVQANWYLKDRGTAKCLPNFAFRTSVRYTDLATDIVILLLPMPIVARLHMSFTRKLKVIFVFLLGFIVVAIAVVRIVVFYEVQRAFNASPWDMSYIVPPNQYWSRAKSAISVVCACLPTLAKIFEKQSRKDISLYFRKRMPLSPLKYSESSDYCSDTSKKGGEVDDIIKLEEPPRLVCEPQPSQQYDVV